MAANTTPTYNNLSMVYRVAVLHATLYESYHPMEQIKQMRMKRGRGGGMISGNIQGKWRKGRAIISTRSVSSQGWRWGCVIRASCRVQDGAHSISSVAVRWVGSLVAPLTVVAVVVAVDAVVGVLADVVLCGGKHGAQNLDVFLSTPPSIQHTATSSKQFLEVPPTHTR